MMSGIVCKEKKTHDTIRYHLIPKIIRKYTLFWSLAEKIVYLYISIRRR